MTAGHKAQDGIPRFRQSKNLYFRQCPPTLSTLLYFLHSTGSPDYIFLWNRELTQQQFKMGSSFILNLYKGQVLLGWTGEQVYYNGLGR